MAPRFLEVPLHLPRPGSRVAAVLAGDTSPTRSAAGISTHTSGASGRVVSIMPGCSASPAAGQARGQAVKRRELNAYSASSAAGNPERGWFNLGCHSWRSKTGAAKSHEKAGDSWQVQQELPTASTPQLGMCIERVLCRTCWFQVDTR